MGKRDYKGDDDRFASAFKFARVEAELSQESVAEQMRDLGFDMSQPVVGKIERGNRRVSIGEAEALASIVKTSLSALLAGPRFLRLEKAMNEMKRRRNDLIEAALRYQGGQQALAMLGDELRRDGDLDAYETEVLEDQLFESIHDVMDEVRRDNIGINLGRQIRDDLDEGDTDERGDTSSDEPERIVSSADGASFLSRFGDHFGDEVNHAVDYNAMVAILGDADEASSDGRENDV